jgi:hypothetical protein
VGFSVATSKESSQPLPGYQHEPLRCHFLDLWWGMQRREFIGLVSGAVVAWPRGARAQQSNRVWRIGVMTSGAERDPEMQARVTVFRQALDRLPFSCSQMRSSSEAAVFRSWDVPDVELKA